MHVCIATSSSSFTWLCMRCCANNKWLCILCLFKVTKGFCCVTTASGFHLVSPLRSFSDSIQTNVYMLFNVWGCWSGSIKADAVDMFFETRLAGSCTLIGEIWCESKLFTWGSQQLEVITFRSAQIVDMSVVEVSEKEKANLHLRWDTIVGTRI